MSLHQALTLYAKNLKRIRLIYLQDAAAVTRVGNFTFVTCDRGPRLQSVTAGASESYHANFVGGKRLTSYRDVAVFTVTASRRRFLGSMFIKMTAHVEVVNRNLYEIFVTLNVSSRTLKYYMIEIKNKFFSKKHIPPYGALLTPKIRPSLGLSPKIGEDLSEMWPSRL